MDRGRGGTGQEAGCGQRVLRCRLQLVVLVVVGRDVSRVGVLVVPYGGCGLNSGRDAMEVRV